MKCIIGLCSIKIFSDRCNERGIVAKEMQLFNHNYFMKSQPRNGQMNLALAICMVYLPAEWFKRNFIRLSIMPNLHGQRTHSRDTIEHIDLSIPVRAGGVYYIDCQLAIQTNFALLQKVTPEPYRPGGCYQQYNY